MTASDRFTDSPDRSLELSSIVPVAVERHQSYLFTFIGDEAART